MIGHGFDFEFKAAWFKRKWQYTTKLLLSYTTNKITEVKSRDSDLASNYVNSGGSLLIRKNINPYSLFSYRWAGLNNQGIPQGYLNDTISTDYTLISKMPLSQLVNKGSAIPPFYGAITHDLSYKNWKLTLNISYRFGYWFNRKPISYDALYRTLTVHPDYAKRWQKPADENTTDIPALIYPAIAGMNAFYTYAEVNVLKADNIKLDWATLSYNIQSGSTSKKGIANARLILNANNLNLMLWKANKQGIDPDFNRNLITPPAFTIGCNITFK